MIITISPKAEKQLSKLPQSIQKKTHRQFSFLIPLFKNTKPSC